MLLTILPRIAHLVHHPLANTAHLVHHPLADTESFQTFSISTLQTDEPTVSGEVNLHTAAHVQPR
jgi:hypothetical protein